MEYFGVFAFILILAYSSYPGKVKIELMDSWIQCQVLDTDDEWIKIRYEDKKKGVVTRLFRIENIDEVEVLG